MTTYAATIWVDGPARPTIDGFRRRWDSQVDVVGAHMTVVYPQPIADDRSVLDRVRRAVASVGSFTVRLDRWVRLGDLDAIHPAGTRHLVSAFPGFPDAIVLLPDATGDAVLDLRRRLDAVFGQPGALLDHPPFVTIAQGMDEPAASLALDELASYRPDLRFEVGAVDVLRADGAGAFRSLGLAGLRGAAAAVER